MKPESLHPPLEIRVPGDPRMACWQFCILATCCVAAAAEVALLTPCGRPGGVSACCDQDQALGCEKGLFVNLCDKGVCEKGDREKGEGDEGASVSRWRTPTGTRSAAEGAHADTDGHGLRGHHASSATGHWRAQGPHLHDLKNPKVLGLMERASNILRQARARERARATKEPGSSPSAT